MAAAVLPASTVTDLALRPKSGWTKIPVCPPGVTCTPTLGVAPSGLPSKITFETGMELMLIVPLPDATTGLSSLGAGVGFGVGVGVGVAVCLVDDGVSGFAGLSGLASVSCCGVASGVLLEPPSSTTNVRSAWPSSNSMFCLKSLKPFLVATMLYGLSE